MVVSFECSVDPRARPHARRRRCSGARVARRRGGPRAAGALLRRDCAGVFSGVGAHRSCTDRKLMTSDGSHLGTTLETSVDISPAEGDALLTDDSVVARSAPFRTVVEAEAPKWFEHRAFGTLNERKYIRHSILGFLCVAPFLGISGTILSVASGCPRHSTTIDLFSAAGRFCLHLMFPMVFHNFCKVVRGASKNQENLDKENERWKLAKEQLEKWFVNEYVHPIQRVFRGGQARRRLAAENQEAAMFMTQRRNSASVLSPAAKATHLGVKLRRLQRKHRADLLSSWDGERDEKHESAVRPMNLSLSTSDAMLHRMYEALKGVELTDMQRRAARQFFCDLVNTRDQTGLDSWDEMAQDVSYDYSYRGYEQMVRKLLEVLYRQREKNRTANSRIADASSTQVRSRRRARSYTTVVATETELEPTACGCYKKANKHANVDDSDGPFTFLAFDHFPSGKHRVNISIREYNLLYCFRASMLAASLLGSIIACMMAYFFITKLTDDSQTDRHGLERDMDDLYFPRPDCVATTIHLRAYHECAVALLVLYVPSILMSSVVLPAWMLSLYLGMILANDDVQDFRHTLSPEKVKQYSTPPQIQRDEHEEARRARAWEIDVALPGALLAYAMMQLNEWGFGCLAILVCCSLFSLGLVPSAVYANSIPYSIVALAALILPVLVLIVPATVSNACDDLLEQLNEISFLGCSSHRERCTQLRHTWTYLNNGQGMGFQMFQM